MGVTACAQRAASYQLPATCGSASSTTAPAESSHKNKLSVLVCSLTPAPPGRSCSLKHPSRKKQRGSRDRQVQQPGDLGVAGDNPPIPICCGLRTAAFIGLDELVNRCGNTVDATDHPDDGNDGMSYAIR